MRRILPIIVFAALSAACPAVAATADVPVHAQPIDQAKVAEIQGLLQKWAQLRSEMTLEDVETIVGPLDQRRVIETLITTRHMAPAMMQNMPSVANRTQEISQSCSAGGTTITFKLVFNAKGKLVQYWMDKPPSGR